MIIIFRALPLILIILAGMAVYMYTKKKTAKTTKESFLMEEEAYYFVLKNLPELESLGADDKELYEKFTEYKEHY